jgi:DNA-binding HxlR family transcriptional regulator
MALLDLTGRRWALRVMWELTEAGNPLTFRDLRDRCAQMSSSVLTRRLDELREAHLVTHDDTGYMTTPLGLDRSNAYSHSSNGAANGPRNSTKSTRRPTTTIGGQLQPRGMLELTDQTRSFSPGVRCQRRTPAPSAGQQTKVGDPRSGERLDADPDVCERE